MIEITAKKDGFRRAGIAHPAGTTPYEDDAFTPSQLKQLQGEPMLVVVVSPDAKDRKKKDKADAATENTGEQA